MWNTSCRLHQVSNWGRHIAVFDKNVFFFYPVEYYCYLNNHMYSLEKEILFCSYCQDINTPTQKAIFKSVFDFHPRVTQNTCTSIYQNVSIHTDSKTCVWVMHHPKTSSVFPFQVAFFPFLFFFLFFWHAKWSIVRQLFKITQISCCFMFWTYLMGSRLSESRVSGFTVGNINALISKKNNAVLWSLMFLMSVSLVKTVWPAAVLSVAHMSLLMLTLRACS